MSAAAQLCIGNLAILYAQLLLGFSHQPLLAATRTATHGPVRRLDRFLSR